jgi:hypothetical protein
MMYIQYIGVGAAPTLRSIKCGRRVKRNSLGIQFREGGAVPSFRSKNYGRTGSQ